MIRITIDENTVEVEEGATILDAAKRAGIRIPTLCHYEGIEPPVSCFVCVVKIEGRSGFVPSCSARAEHGMVVQSQTDEIRTRRRQALELLLSEHAGDCEAPCKRICPAGLDIPEMIRRMESGDIDGGMHTIKNSIPLPGVLGHICAAPCEKGCRRNKTGSAITIRELHKHAALADLNTAKPWRPFIQKSTGKKVAVIGAGPAGLSVSYYLACKGHACTLFDKNPVAGGALAYEISESDLPPAVLKSEIAVIQSLGVRFVLDKEILSPQELLGTYNAVVLATGEKSTERFGLECDMRGVKVRSDTSMTVKAGVFACGAAVLPGKIAARSVGQGNKTADAVDRYLNVAETMRPAPKGFDCRMSKMSDKEFSQFTQSAPPRSCIDVRGTDKIPAEIISELHRCYQCDCGKKEACALREYAHEYGAVQRRFDTGNRKIYSRREHASGLVYEPGKCITCGRCAGITASKNIAPGLTFYGRGSGVYVDAPFGHPMDLAMGDAFNECVKACPTGALWVRNTPHPNGPLHNGKA